MDEFIEALEHWHCIGCETLIPFEADTCGKIACRRLFAELGQEMDDIADKFAWWDE